MSRFLPSPLITKALNPSSAYFCLIHKRGQTPFVRFCVKVCKSFFRLRGKGYLCRRFVTN